MPKSRSRKPARRPRTDRATAGMTPSAVRSWFTATAAAKGHPFTRSAYHPLGQPTYCWTNAWLYAREHGLGYAEGVVAMPNGVHAHAWAVAADGTAVEVTTGYDVATGYLGWSLNLAEVEAATHDWGLGRSSILETAYGSAVAPWPVLLARLAAPR